ncbi:phytanoyl-CoA dioxygenase family protein [Kaistia hirudinis]|uniref:phytanoyl-CoA dioxygenase family protein n=1 Tax=Kaistia hirudinis TaxID=1293440 RepID=UPI0016223FA9|nr:phytanoyl-CoA dioxygenase family protein [Kaistia hirudinis]
MNRHRSGASEPVLRLASEGAQLFSGAAISIVGTLLDHLSDIVPGRAGVRLAGRAGFIESLNAAGAIGRIAASLTGNDAVRPVRAVLFDKADGVNWSLGWHQDRTICVEERIDVAGYGPWTTKAGLVHVEPPFELLARMITLRVHLDDVPATNAPLLVAPGSHRFGRVPIEEIPAIVDQCGVAACLARAGDIWAYSTPIVHASERSAQVGRRRVLQIDYARDALPDGLSWRGI